MNDRQILIRTITNGQTRKYGPCEYEYEIHTKGFYLTEVEKFCTDFLRPHFQTLEEWRERKEDDVDAYFRGYHIFKEIEMKISEEGCVKGKFSYFVHIPSTH